MFRSEQHRPKPLRNGLIKLSSFQHQERYRLWPGSRLLGQPGGQALHGPRRLAIRWRTGKEEEEEWKTGRMIIQDRVVEIKTI
jgi:hypothetical protein